MMFAQQTETVTTISVKAAPPLAVISAQLAGLAVDDWIKWITLIYVALMLVHKMWVMGLEVYHFWKRNEPPKSDDE